MDAFKLSIKFFLQPGSAFEQAAVVRTFHTWIQNHTVAEHLLIDVADYHHVENGPGTVLVAHEGNYSTDSSIGDAPGLLYVRKQPIDGDLVARLRQTLKYTLQAAVQLEEATQFTTPPRFRTDNPVFRIYDRLLAPNEPATFDAVRPALESALAKLYDGSVTLEYQPNDEKPFEVKITAPGSPSAADLLAKL